MVGKHAIQIKSKRYNLIVLDDGIAKQKWPAELQQSSYNDNPKHAISDRQIDNEQTYKLSRTI